MKISILCNWISPWRDSNEINRDFIHKWKTSLENHSQAIHNNEIKSNWIEENVRKNAPETMRARLLDIWFLAEKKVSLCIIHTMWWTNICLYFNSNLIWWKIANHHEMPQIDSPVRESSAISVEIVQSKVV